MPLGFVVLQFYIIMAESKESRLILEYILQNNSDLCAQINFEWLVKQIEIAEEKENTTFFKLMYWMKKDIVCWIY